MLHDDNMAAPQDDTFTHLPPWVVLNFSILFFLKKVFAAHKHQIPSKMKRSAEKKDWKTINLQQSSSKSATDWKHWEATVN